MYYLFNIVLHISLSKSNSVDSKPFRDTLHLVGVAKFYLIIIGLEYFNALMSI
jgi:hypothetical protein